MMHGLDLIVHIVCFFIKKFIFPYLSEVISHLSSLLKKNAMP